MISRQNSHPGENSPIYFIVHDIRVKYFNGTPTCQESFRFKVDRSIVAVVEIKNDRVRSSEWAQSILSVS